LAPRWDDVDLGRLSMHIVEGHSMGVTDTPKSRAALTVPLAEEVGRALAGVGLGGVMTGPRDLVFVAPNGGHVDLTTFRARFYAAQDRAGVKPRRDVRQLRNTFGTVCASAGVPLRTLQQWMGHESITTTEIYASFMPRTKTPPRSPARSPQARSRQAASLNRRVAEHAATPFRTPFRGGRGVVAARPRPPCFARPTPGISSWDRAARP
jgi:integrase